jgi:hypothetical protein
MNLPLKYKLLLLKIFSGLNTNDYLKHKFKADIGLIPKDRILPGVEWDDPPVKEPEKPVVDDGSNELIRSINLLIEEASISSIITFRVLRDALISVDKFRGFTEFLMMTYPTLNPLQQSFILTKLYTLVDLMGRYLGKSSEFMKKTLQFLRIILYIIEVNISIINIRNLALKVCQ